MKSALVVSNTKDTVAFLSDILKALACKEIVPVETCAEAGRLLLEKSFDICIIDSPISDTSGEDLARYIATNEVSQVILILNSDVYEKVTADIEEMGVVTVSKPINRNLIISAIKLLLSVNKKVQIMQTENIKLVKKMEDLRIIDRAKLILISYLSMTEPEAHRYIEKQAMDMRITKRAVAESILKTYEY